MFFKQEQKDRFKIKDELNGIEMQEFISLKAKMYSVLYGNIEMKKAKGIKKNIIKQQILHADYRECMNEYKSCVHSIHMIRSKNIKYIRFHKIKQHFG